MQAVAAHRGTRLMVEFARQAGGTLLVENGSETTVRLVLPDTAAAFSAALDIG